MKSIILFGLVALVAAASAGVTDSTHPRGCIFVLGKCKRECEEGTHGYGTGCGKMTPEPTCEVPNPVEAEGIICDYTACYCDAPTVRDTKTKKCVPLDKCSK